jgi:hypothetical protein
LQEGLSEYKALTPQSLLDRKGNVDVNAAPNIIRVIIPLLRVGRGCRASMESLVKRIEDRIGYLIEIEKSHANLFGPKPPTPAAPIVDPPPKPPAPLTPNNKFYPHLPTR